MFTLNEPWSIEGKNSVPTIVTRKTDNAKIIMARIITIPR